MLLLDGFVDFLEAFVLGREAAFGGRVDDEDDLAGVAVERDRLAFLYLLVSLRLGQG